MLVISTGTVSNLIINSNMSLLEGTLPTRISNKSLDSRKPGQPRIFGKDITNMAEKTKPNHSLYQKVVTKPEGPPRPKSVSSKEKPVEKCPTDEYQQDIIQQLLKGNECSPSIKCPTVSLRMRAILLDWLVDVHSQFQLKEDTLHMAIKVLDDYCALEQDISKKTLQLVGITCLWIASKYEEIYPPKMKNYVVVTDNTYTYNQIHNMQAKILATLQFRILKTTHHQYLSLILGPELDSQVGSLCRYLIQLSNLQMVTVEYRPTVLVLAALQMCQSLLKQKTPLKRFKEQFKAQQDQLNRCFRHLCKLVSSGTWEELVAVRRKYSKAKFHSVGRTKLQKV